ncbi:hypothetical protein JOC86_003755 [Bacillus pakistanensis]|uniref:Uncharacterized protein n=1 Tax=Rossellomorea pakistanensis TaxID=992288 RepID=A0ABS2NH48_9BACI|nr:hypothetical protein [Bacillus pakistanensis]MBM7587182.1 hypothetical protein [Bacillus pakistanensis]
MGLSKEAKKGSQQTKDVLNGPPLEPVKSKVLKPNETKRASDSISRNYYVQNLIAKKYGLKK